MLVSFLLMGKKHYRTSVYRKKIYFGSGCQWSVGSSTEHHVGAKLLLSWQPENGREETGSNGGEVQGQGTLLKDGLSRADFLQFVLFPRLLLLPHSQSNYKVINGLTHWWGQVHELIFLIEFQTPDLVAWGSKVLTHHHPLGGISDPNWNIILWNVDFTSRFIYLGNTLSNIPDCT